MKHDKSVCDESAERRSQSPIISNPINQLNPPEIYSFSGVFFAIMYWFSCRLGQGREFWMLNFGCEEVRCCDAADVEKKRKNIFSAKWHING